ncbi:MAG: hypothetical protein VBE63_25860 [Lamprobacter sp.]|uniref:hypothetical protein n=1 Tax=Lamprobacter sp. TaxID=3100796 RepID=UPI002B259295|nr:hypothetical protein [Lamprobacter sp.]MEA3643334.1 hypothetical protein [Lamprobacter sp.]
MATPSSVYEVIAITLALVALILWLAVSAERRYHRLPLVTASVLVLSLMWGHEQVWAVLWALALRIQGLLSALAG